MSGAGAARSPVGNHLRRLRFEQSEMTQDELARAAGITRQTVIALEAQRYAPSLDLAFRLARVFDKPINEVFYWSEPT